MRISALNIELDEYFAIATKINAENMEWIGGCATAEADFASSLRAIADA